VDEARLYSIEAAEFWNAERCWTLTPLLDNDNEDDDNDSGNRA
jgi:hypothetical protein